MTEPSRPSARLPLRARVLLPLFALILLWATYQLYGTDPEGAVQEVHGDALGTTWSVKLASTGLTPELDQATAREIVTRVGTVDALMSTWLAESELSHFNATRSTQPLALSAKTIQVFEIARQVSEQSGGAFDVTVGPLVQAWGFGSEGRKAAPPDASTIATLMELVGYEKLEIDPARNIVRKRVPQLAVDLSAVAKGFAVDQLALGLASLGHEGFLVEIGGELRAKGTHLDGTPWRVAIETPDSPDRSIQQVVELHDMSMATSGDYRNYYESEGRRVSHTIDPRTGRPIEHRLASVTVLHPEAAWADAWATALNVLGPDEGYELALKLDLAAYLIVRRESGPGFETRVTPAFEKVLALNP